MHARIYAVRSFGKLSTVLVLVLLANGPDIIGLQRIYT
jgi:hypothetical protein